jgi:hypothetical protein
MLLMPSSSDGIEVALSQHTNFASSTMLFVDLQRQPLTETETMFLCSQAYMALQKEVNFFFQQAGLKPCTAKASMARKCQSG